MVLLQADSLNLSFGERTILSGVSLRIASRQRIALAGANGSGKSTLLKILAGLQESEGGQVSSPAGVRIAYLPQSGLDHSGQTLYTELETAFNAHFQDEQRLRDIESEMAAAGSDESILQNLIEEQHQIQESILASRFYQREQYIFQVLKGLGFRNGDEHRLCEEFSGGWQMRIALAKILLEHPQVMLLDEPTNYLDLDAREWLAGELERFEGGVLMVSHDRGFLDQTVSAVAELFLGGLKLYKGNYSTYETLRNAELEQLVKQYEQQQTEIQQLEDFIRRFRANESKAAQVQSRVKQLEKIVPIRIPENLKKMNIRFPEASRSGDIVLSVEALTKSWGTQPMYQGVDFILNRGERTVLLGPNGVGKSTLLRMIAGTDTDFGGEIRTGAKVETAYFAQDAEEGLDTSRTVIEEVEQAAPTELIPQLRSMLGAFLFRGDDIHKPISVLSGGEKNRVALVKMLLKPSNLLILDEPTNHLDLASKEVLLDALKQYGGTLLFVSHDRFFINALANRVIELQLPDTPGNYRQIRDYPGDFSYYLSQKHRENTEPTAAPGAARASGATGPGHSGADASQPASIPAGKNDHQQQKELRSKITRLKKQSEELLTSIDSTEATIADIQHRMSLEENYSDGEIIRKLTDELQSQEGRLEELHETWAEIEEQLSELEN